MDREVRESMMKINPVSQYGIRQCQKSINKDEAGMKAAQSEKAEFPKQATDLQSSPAAQVERQAKIDEIKTQIENGTYQVNIKATAESLLNVYSKKQ